MSTKVGVIAEMQFKLMALELNIPIFEPVLDIFGIDFVVIKNKKPIKIQIKSTVKQDVSRKNSYRVSVAHGNNSQAYKADTFDYLVVYIFELHTWYVIPQENVRVTKIRINPTSNECKYYSFKERWDYLI